MTCGCRRASGGITRNCGGSSVRETLPSESQTPSPPSLIPDSYKREDDLRFDRLAEGCGRSEFHQRDDLTDPAIHFRIRRPRKNVIVQDPPFIPNVSFNG